MSKQAFNDWHAKLPFPTGYEAVGVEAMYICWQAACAYQREIDADWLEMQRNCIPATGTEFANALRANKGD